MSVTLTRPVLLTEVIVSALSAEAYHLANSPESPLEAWFSDEHPIIRYGSPYMFSSDQLHLNGHHTSECAKTFAYRFDMVEPVLQGIAQRGTTRFIVILNDFPDSSSMILDIPLQPELETDEEGIEIDEGFLAGSTFPSPIFTSVNNRPNSRLSPNGASTTGSEVAFRIKPLSEALDTSQDHCTVYLRTADLGRFGFLNGDWVSSVNFLFDQCHSTYSRQWLLRVIR